MLVVKALYSTIKKFPFLYLFLHARPTNIFMIDKLSHIVQINPLVNSPSGAVRCRVQRSSHLKVDEINHDVRQLRVDEAAVSTQLRKTAGVHLTIRGAQGGIRFRLCRESLAQYQVKEVGTGVVYKSASQKSTARSSRMRSTQSA